MKPRFVLDAWAILAFLQQEEPAAARVQTLLEEAERGDSEVFVSIINLGEVSYRIGKVKGETEAQETLDQIRGLSLTTIPATEEGVFAAARLKMRHAIPYADAFAAATAASLGAVLVTGDPELLQLSERILIEKLERTTDYGR